MLLTFVISELQIVVHGGHKLLNDETPYDRRQVTFTPHFPVEDLNVVICRGTRSKLCIRLLEELREIQNFSITRNRKQSTVRTEVLQMNRP